MGHIFTSYKLKMVKEKSGVYEVSNTISNPQNAYNIMTKIVKIQEECEEVLYVITLNVKNNVTGLFEVSRGSLNSSIVHPREILKRAILNNAAAIVLCHNHPSGNPEPSREDIGITSRVKECGNIIGIDLLDHIIIGDENYVSLKDLNCL